MAKKRGKGWQLAVTRWLYDHKKANMQLKNLKKAADEVQQLLEDFPKKGS